MHPCIKNNKLFLFSYSLNLSSPRAAQNTRNCWGSWTGLQRPPGHVPPRALSLRYTHPYIFPIKTLLGRPTSSRGRAEPRGHKLTIPCMLLFVEAQGSCHVRLCSFSPSPLGKDQDLPKGCSFCLLPCLSHSLN